MERPQKLVDLCPEPASRLMTAAFYAVKDLQRGETIVLLTPEEPSLLMQSLDLQLRNALRWTISATAAGTWRIEIRHRADVAPADVLDALRRDHQRLDELFSRAMRLVSGGETAEVDSLMAEFGALLRRHIKVENDLLAARFPLRRDGHESDPLSIMLREHDEILNQLTVIEAYFAEGIPQPGEVDAFFAILSGTLAKHEYREENNLFPLWSALLHQQEPQSQQELLAQVQRELSGGQ
jgi:uncharacterized protein (DUF2249 family)/iron-sulfur cluster repair protein YtfE (RIC family)